VLLKSKHLPKETQTALDDYCTRHNVPRQGMEQLKPWVVAVTIAAMAWQQAGEDPSLGIDMHFLDESKPPQRIDELESMESQLCRGIGARAAKHAGRDPETGRQDQRHHQAHVGRVYLR